MANAAAQVETAFSFLELLEFTNQQRFELEDYLDDFPVPPMVSEAWDDTEKAIRIANATWVKKLIDSDLLATIERYLVETPLQVRRNPFAGTVTLATPGVLNGLKAKAVKQQRDRESETDGRCSSVEVKTYKEILRDGVVDWTIRTAADEGYEIRSCAQCAKWFEPQLKARSRFCSAKCRKNFNNFRNSDHNEYNHFTCGGCEMLQPMDEFAGLAFDEEAKGTPATALRMGRYRPAAKNLCCVDCVRSKYTEWRQYIAPMESLSERVLS